MSRRVKIAALVIAALLVIDFLRPPESQLTARFLLGSIDLYQAAVSPLLGKSGVRCRFQPTCSHYGEAAIRKYGTVKGMGKAAWRILRCGPWTSQGTVDLP